MSLFKEYIAFKGSCFTIEWYFDKNGKSAALQYYKKLSMERRIQILKLIKRLGDIGSIQNVKKFRYEGDKIFAFKPIPDRFLCFFFLDKKVIITNAFVKKADKLDMTEKDKALKAKNDYFKRVTEWEYYE